MSTQSEKPIFLKAKQKKRLDWLPWGLFVLVIVYLGAFVIATQDGETSRDQSFTKTFHENHRSKRETNQHFTTIANEETTANESLWTRTTPPEITKGSQGIYPPDYFDLDMRRKGAVVLHVLGMLYMFAALAIVCDEFFVPALEVITFRLSISDDVAGATFMAAGGSAPELFTSIIGVFLAKSNVGIGTIVGSAVFNILFVIGMCALFSHEILKLTWWPLFRDCSFYVISLLFLIYSFTDSEIQYWESIVLITIYLCYVTFMKFNQKLETWMRPKASRMSCRSKTTRPKNKISPSVRAIVEAISNPDDVAAHPKNTFSYGIVQLIMHSLDPTSEEDQADDKEKASQLYAIAREKLISPRAARALATRCTSPIKTTTNGKCDQANRPATPTTVVYENEGVKVVAHDGTDAITQIDTSATSPGITNGNNSENKETFNGKAPHVQGSRKASVVSEDDMGEALDMSWPQTNAKRCVFLVLFPIMFVLWLTLPDVRKPEKEKYFMASFFGSILWIAIFSYFMVWMAHQIGQTIGISETIMGLTFLAAGTSVPDLITSVIVARKGLGDMAVSSSVGSNIFDVTIGLPFPWLLKSIIFLGEPVTVESRGLFCSMLLLFAMLLFVVISIALFRWRMNKKLGLVMLVLYAGFLVLVVLLELSIIICPVNTS